MATAEGFFNHFPDLARQIELVTSELVRKAAFDIEAEAKERAPVDTGFLRSSVYTVTDHSSTYGQFAGNGPAFPELDHPSSPTEADVAVAAEYGIYVELGTRHMGAQPYLIPSAEHVRPQFTEAMARLEEHLRSGGGE